MKFDNEFWIIATGLFTLAVIVGLATYVGVSYAY